MDESVKLLLAARRRAGLSQAELARKAGLPRSVLNAYERGKREPGADTLSRILHAAGFELRLARGIDDHRNAELFAQVLELAEGLPYRARKTLRYPPLRRRIV